MKTLFLLISLFSFLTAGFPHIDLDLSGLDSVSKLGKDLDNVPKSVQKLPTKVIGSKEDKIFASCIISIKETNYKKKAKNDLYTDIASQIYTQVSTSSQQTSSEINGKYRSNFQYKASTTTLNIPLYHVVFFQEKTQGKYYYLKAVFDFQKSKQTYIKKSEELVKYINSTYENYKKSSKIYVQEQLLKKAIVASQNLQKHQIVLSLFLDNSQIPQANIKTAQMQKELISLYDHSATNIQDLAKILAKRLNYTALDSPLLIEPIMLRDGHLYSEFSYQFKDYLVNEVRHYTQVSQSSTSKFILKGYYHIENKKVIVSLFISDKNANVLSSTIASMYIKNDKKLLKKYQALQDTTDNSKILNEYLQGW